MTSFFHNPIVIILIYVIIDYIAHFIMIIMVIIDLCAVIFTIYTLLLPRTLILKLTKKSFRVLDTYLLIFTTFVLDSMQCLPKARSASFFSWSKDIIAGTR